MTLLIFFLAHLCEFNNTTLVFGFSFVSMWTVRRRDGSKWGPATVLTQAVAIMSEFEPWVAQAVVGADGVFTRSISTRVSLTLVNICKQTVVQRSSAF